MAGADVKPKKRKQKSPKQLAKEKAWEAFSLFIRTRDCLRTTFSPDEGSCVTCSERFPIKLLQAGHFIDGRNNAVLFSEQGVHAQCYACNIRKHGNKLKYWLFMEQAYGREVIDALILESNKTVVYKTADYEQISQHYRGRTEAMLKDRSLAVLVNPLPF